MSHLQKMHWADKMAEAHLKRATYYFQCCQKRGIDFKTHHLRRLLRELPFEIDGERISRFWISFEYTYFFSIRFDDTQEKIILLRANRLFDPRRTSIPYFSALSSNSLKVPSGS